MRDIERTCIFESGNYKVVYRSFTDVVRNQMSHHTQIIHTVKPEWHLDFRPMIIDNWEDADDLVNQLVNFVDTIKEGEEHGTL